eukprot:m.50099 g.50099  ORF g.50099 m.50099 type:complete len:585 (+) comp12524_c0_seq1:76-1830(+)
MSDRADTTGTSTSGGSISFSLGSSSHKQKQKQKQLAASAASTSGFQRDDAGTAEKGKVEFLNRFEDTTPLAEKKEEKPVLVIPLRQVNDWKDPTALASSTTSSSSTDREPQTETPLTAEEQLRQALLAQKKASGEDGSESRNQAASEGEKRTLTLEQRAIDAILSSKNENQKTEIEAIPLLMQNRAPGTEQAANEEEKFKMDVAQRPDECSLEDYDRVPVDQFGAAMLRGMGWKEGEPIGGKFKGLVEPIEYVPRMNRLGLGATRDLELKPDYKHRQKKYIKPGETRTSTTQVSAKVGEDGKVRNIKKASEQLREEEVVRMQRGAYVFVMKGAHKGHAGTITRLHNLLVDVKLALSEAIITVDEGYVQPVSSADYKDRVSMLRRHGVDAVLRQQEDDDQEDRRERRRSQADRDAGDSRHKHQRSRDSQDRERQHDSKKRNKDRDAERYKQARDVDDRHESKRSKREEIWVCPDIRVRVVSETYQRGKQYNKKVRVVDVMSSDSITCLTDEGKMLEGLRQKDLETLIPKQLGDRVIVVKGKYRGHVGTLLDRLKKREEVLLQFEDDSRPHTASFDDVCEYLGQEH